MTTVTLKVKDAAGHLSLSKQVTINWTAPAVRTLFGAFPGYTDAVDHSESYASRLARVTALFGGKLGVERIYQGASLVLPTLNGPSIVSWDFPVASTLAGTNNAAIDAIARANKPLWLVPWHEVENGKLNATDYKAVFQYVANRVEAVGNPLVKMTTMMMGFTIKNQVLTTFNSYYPGDAYVDAIGFDQYVNPGIPAFATPAGAFSAPPAVAAAHGKPLVIGEVSLYPGYTAQQWLDYVVQIIGLLDKSTVDAVAWFETNKSDGDWRMARFPNAVAQWAPVSSRS